MTSILLIESSASIRQALKIVLELRGHEVVVFGESPQTNYDRGELVLLDPRVPGGRELVARRRAAGKPTPLIVLAEPHEGGDLRADLRLDRPFRLAVLERAIAAVTRPLEARAPLQ